MAFVGESVEPGSVDGWLGYGPLESDGYRHEVSYLDGQRNCSPAFIAVVKRWILGVKEPSATSTPTSTTFRFKPSPEASSSMQQAVAVQPVPYKPGRRHRNTTDNHHVGAISKYLS